MQCVFFFNDTATTEIYTLSLHDALPISDAVVVAGSRDGVLLAASAAWLGPGRTCVVEDPGGPGTHRAIAGAGTGLIDRKSTRLNSSHANISYAVFCLIKKNKKLVGPRS